MKKLFLALIISGMMFTNALATEGTVKEIKVYSSGDAFITFTKSSDGLDTNSLRILGDAESVKKILSLALTAKSTGSTVDWAGQQIGGVWGWTSLTIK